MYWEYDSRIGRRWNLDPEPITGISEYATLNNSPILYSDVLGNSSEPPGWYTKARTVYMLFMHGIGGDASKAGDDFDRGMDKAFNVSLKSGAQIKADASETAGNIGGSLLGNMDGLLRAGSFGIMSRSAGSLGLNEKQSEYYDAASNVWSNALMYEGVSGGPTSSPSFAVSGAKISLAKVASTEITLTTIALSNAVQNKKDGIAREEAEYESLREQHPDAQIWRERYLRDANGKIVKDPDTKTGRRIDFSVMKDGIVSNLVEVTSLTAPKSKQYEKEMRIRAAGGTYIRAPGKKGLLYSVQDILTQLSKRP